MEENIVSTCEVSVYAILCISNFSAYSFYQLKSSFIAKRLLNIAQCDKTRYIIASTEENVIYAEILENLKVIL